MEKILTQKKEIINNALNNLLLIHFKEIPNFYSMISYAFFPGEKRLRPILAIAINEVLGGTLEYVIDSACTIEFFHVATLLLDDLPCMDNDNYRQKKLAFHKKFGIYDAILTSFGLCKKAFEILADKTNNNKDLIKQSAINMGFNGLIGGQKIDLDIQKKFINTKNDVETLNYIVKNKTAKLFKLSAIVGTHFTKATEEQKKLLIEYAYNLGFAFQILDDLKTPNEKNPLTFYKLYGYETALKILKTKVNKAIKQIESFGDKAKFLKFLALVIINKAEKLKLKANLDQKQINL